jgi:hypothetical protein
VIKALIQQARPQLLEGQWKIATNSATCDRVVQGGHPVALPAAERLAYPGSTFFSNIFTGALAIRLNASAGWAIRRPMECV